MAKEIVQADLGRIRALLDEVLGRSDYSDVQRMGGLTNRTYCVSFADGSRIMVRIPGEGTEELIDRADEKVSTELACRLGIDAKLYFFGDDGEKVSQFVPNAVTMSDASRKPSKIAIIPFIRTKRWKLRTKLSCSNSVTQRLQPLRRAASIRQLTS